MSPASVQACLSIGMLWAVLGAVLVLGGCKREEVVRAEQEQLEALGYQPRRWTDPETGCQYLTLAGHGIAARRAADGMTVMGCRSAP